MISVNQNNNSLVSIIMNCHNCEDFLSEAIDSIYSQTYQNWEIIFWDNCSTDSSAEIAMGYDNRLKYYCGENKIKLYAARNLAMEKCAGEFIAFLDCDDYWYPNKQTDQIPLFKDPEVGIVYGDSLVFNQKRRKRSFTMSLPIRGYCFNKLVEDYFFNFQTIVIRASSLIKYSIRFDERLNNIGDCDLLTRLSKYVKIDYCQDLVAAYRISADSLSFTANESVLHEGEIMIENLKSRFPNIFSSNAGVLDRFKDRLKYHYAKKVWLSGNGSECRRVVKSASRVRFREIKLYFASFINPKYLKKYVF